MRFVLYSPDSYGLGHVRRSVAVAGAVLDRSPRAWARVLTGAPRAHYFDYPRRCDYVKLPPVTKNASGRYVAQDEELTLRQAIALRSHLIRDRVVNFRPDVFVVDHNPVGLCREVLPTLRRLERVRPATQRVLVMRDVVDEAQRVRQAWADEGVIDVLRRHYDRILVAGQQELFDPVAEYGIPGDVASKTEFVGYIPRMGRRSEAARLKARLAPASDRLVVVTLGGGGDGDRLLRSFCRGYASLGERPGFEVVAVTGPLMSPRKRDRFRALAEALPGLTLLEYTADLPDLLEAADLVVSMGGYNTVCELACAGARALIVPRSFPRKEQLVRAQLLHRRGVARYLEPDQASPAALIREVNEGLTRPRPERGWGLDFGGLRRTVDRLVVLEAAPNEIAAAHDVRVAS